MSRKAWCRGDRYFDILRAQRSFVSVYTHLTETQVEKYLDRYAIGKLVSLHGISEGVENTNYSVETSNGRYVLTLFEWLKHHELPYYLALMAHVARAGLPAPYPVADVDGHYLQELSGKPAVLVAYLSGHTVNSPTVSHCRLAGDALAAMHLAMKNFMHRCENVRGLAWCIKSGNQILPLLAPEDSTLLHSELAHQQKLSLGMLPQGTIHADLFPDNVLFSVHTLTGILDFYYAGDDALVYDLAVTVNAWCFDERGGLEEQRLHALMQGYCARRMLEAGEERVWRDALRRAALRFWISRLNSKLFPKSGQLTQIKDPDYFKNILRFHRDCAAAVTESAKVQS